MDQLCPLDLSLPSAKETSWTDQEHIAKAGRRNSVSDGESGQSRSRSGSPTSLSSSPSPSDLSDSQSDSKHHLKRFLHKYQAEQSSQEVKSKEHYPFTSLVNNKDLISYGEIYK